MSLNDTNRFFRGIHKSHRLCPGEGVGPWSRTVLRRVRLLESVSLRVVLVRSLRRHPQSRWSDRPRGRLGTPTPRPDPLPSWTRVILDLGPPSAVRDPFRPKFFTSLLLRHTPPDPPPVPRPTNGKCVRRDRESVPTPTVESLTYLLHDGRRLFVDSQLFDCDFPPDSPLRDERMCYTRSLHDKPRNGHWGTKPS